MHAIAPVALAEEWDNVGLLAGDASRPLAGPVLLTIDLTHAVLDEAIAMKVGAIISYHPPIFSPIRSIRADTPAGARLLRLIEHRIALYSPHTALDAAPGGLTDWLIAQATEPVDAAACSALAAARALDPRQTHKVVVFVPRDAAERMREAMASAGAGVIGGYEQCSYALEGVGTFLAGEGTNPAVGRRGRLETVNEVRLEMVCGEGALPAVVAALRAVHPYEEPAFDIYSLTPKPRAGIGPGRIATLAMPTDVEEIARRLKARLPSRCVSVAAHEGRSLPKTRGTQGESRSQKDAASSPSTPSASSVVHRLAAVPGSGAALLDAAIAAGAQCFVTGEMKHHEVLSALDRGCAIVLAGHTETERGYLPTLAARLNTINGGFAAVVSKADAPPLRPV